MGCSYVIVLGDSAQPSGFFRAPPAHFYMQSALVGGGSETPSSSWHYISQPLSTTGPLYMLSPLPRTLCLHDRPPPTCLDTSAHSSGLRSSAAVSGVLSDPPPGLGCLAHQTQSQGARSRLCVFPRGSTWKEVAGSHAVLARRAGVRCSLHGAPVALRI